MARAGKVRGGGGPPPIAPLVLSAAPLPSAAAALAAARPAMLAAPALVLPAAAASPSALARFPNLPAASTADPAPAPPALAAAPVPVVVPLDLPAAEAAVSPAEQQADIERQRGYTHLGGLQRHYDHKSKWSYFLMWMMAGMLGFQSLLLALVGFELWDFTGYAWLLPALLVQNLAQIAGLCVIVVKSLFKDIN